MRSAVVAFLTLLLATGCAPATGGASVPSPPLGAPGGAPPPPRSGTARPLVSATPPPPSSAPAGSPALPPPRVLCAERLHEEPVTSIAVAENGRIATFGADAFYLEAGRLRPLPLPSRFRPKEGERFSATIFFGRDHWPRLMGTRTAIDGTLRPIYLRYTPTGNWGLEPTEIGRFAAPGAELFGVLGWEDPEVVCRAGDACVIKRRRGWQTIAPPPHPLEVIVSHGEAWALGDGALRRLGDAGWESVELDDGRPVGAALAVADDGSHWVVDAAATTLWVKLQDSWERRAAIPATTALLARSSREVYGLDAEGLWHFDGSQVTPVTVQGAAPPFAAFTFASEGTLLLGGRGGLWRVSTATSCGGTPR